MDSQSSDEIYKSIKTNGQAQIRSNGQATTEEDDEDDDTVAGPELPPDLEDEAGDDEEGRFFGGGINRDTAEVLSFIDDRDGEASAVCPARILLYLRDAGRNIRV